MAAASPEEAPMEDDRTNYRTMGRGNGGVLRKRQPVWKRERSTPTPASIPARFETVLYKDNKERVGFGQHAPRFTHTRDKEAPGPGTYTGSSDVCAGRIGNRSASVGVRGSGAFASRAPRLGDGSKKIAPGPGTYVPEARPMSARGRDAVPSAVFVEPGSVNPARFIEKSMPGPGDYDVGAAQTARPQPRDVGVVIPRCGDGGERFPLPSSATPGPGTYHDVRFRALVPPPAPPKGAQEAKSSKAASETHVRRASEAILSGEAPLRHGQAPGPGAYEPQLAAVKGRTDHGVQGTSGFRLGNSHLPRSWRPIAPGPTDYNPKSDEAPAEKGAVAVFRSDSPRFRRQRPAAPGPAFYSPRKPEAAQSFLLNSQNTWVC